MTEVKTLEELEAYAKKILEAAEAEREQLAELINTEAEAIEQLRQAMKAETDHGNTARYLQLKKELEDQQAIITMHKTRYSKLSEDKEPLIPKEEYKRYLDMITAEATAARDEAIKELEAIQEKGKKIYKHINETRARCNTLYRLIQGKLYRYADCRITRDGGPVSGDVVEVEQIKYFNAVGWSAENAASIIKDKLKD